MIFIGGKYSRGYKSYKVTRERATSQVRHVGRSVKRVEESKSWIVSGLRSREFEVRFGEGAETSRLTTASYAPCSIFTKTESPASLDQLARGSRPPAVKFAPANR